MTVERPRHEPNDPAAGLPLHRHGLGFLFSGLLAFLVDAAVLEAGVRLLGVDPLLARIAAISIAMLCGWLAHRRFTFAIATEPSLGEFFRYALAGSGAALLNYALFALQLLISPTMPRLIALAIASAGAMVFAYLAMRYGVFRKQQTRR